MYRIWHFMTASRTLPYDNTLNNGATRPWTISQPIKPIKFPNPHLFCTFALPVPIEPARRCQLDTDRSYGCRRHCFLEIIILASTKQKLQCNTWTQFSYLSFSRVNNTVVTFRMVHLILRTKFAVLLSDCCLTCKHLRCQVETKQELLTYILT